MSLYALVLPLLLSATQDPMRVLDGDAREQQAVRQAVQQAVRQAVQQGRYVPLETVVRDALKRYPGKLLEVELDDDTYEIEILGPNGKVMELDYDARNGRLLKMEED